MRWVVEFLDVNVLLFLELGPGGWGGMIFEMR